MPGLISKKGPNGKNQIYGGALKERRNGRAGKRSSKNLKMDNNELSTNPQLDSPGKIHTYWSRPPVIPDFVC